MTTVSNTSHWRDRKRILTMPIGSTEYHLTDAYLSITNGLVRQTNYNVLLYRIHNIECRQGLRQRLVNQGDIILNWSDGSKRTSVIENIKNPMQVKEMILTLSENAKRSRYYRDNRRRQTTRYERIDTCFEDLDDEDDWL